jgi:hypothetical protein
MNTGILQAMKRHWNILDQNNEKTMKHSYHWIMTGLWYGEQWDFQNNEMTMKHSYHWIMTGWYGEQWDFQNNEKTMEHSDHWIMTEMHWEQWDSQNNEKTMENSSHCMDPNCRGMASVKQNTHWTIDDRWINLYNKETQFKPKLTKTLPFLVPVHEYHNRYNYRTNSRNCYRSSKAFIFSLKNKDDLPAFQSRPFQNYASAICADASKGTEFSNDIKISDFAGSNIGSSSSLGYTYRPPPGYGYGQSKTKALLAGSASFTPDEIEVFFEE